MITMTVNFPDGSDHEMEFNSIKDACLWLKDHVGEWSSFQIIGTNPLAILNV